MWAALISQVTGTSSCSALKIDFLCFQALQVAAGTSWTAGEVKGATTSVNRRKQRWVAFNPSRIYACWSQTYFLRDKNGAWRLPTKFIGWRSGWRSTGRLLWKCCSSRPISEEKASTEEDWQRYLQLRRLSYLQQTWDQVFQAGDLEVPLPAKKSEEAP